MQIRIACTGFALALLLAAGGCNVSQGTAANGTAKAASTADGSTINAATADVSTETLNHSNWPLFRGDPLSSGVASTVLPDELSLVWSYSVEDGAFESTAAIVDGVVYIGDLDGKIYALELASGNKVWEYATDDPLGFEASPAVRDDRVYLGDIDGRFYSLDATTSHLNWTYTIDGVISSSANFFQDRVLVGSQDATLYCLDAGTSALVWKYSTENMILCSTSVVENRAFLVGCDAKLHIVDLDNGRAIHKVELDGPSGTTPAVHGDFAYFGTHVGTIYCVNWRTGEKQWTYQVPEKAEFVRSSAAVNEKIVVIGSRSKRVYALDPQSGTPRWNFATRRDVESSPVIVGDRVFVGSKDGRLYALSVNNGNKIWEYEAGGSITASPAVADGRLVIANDAGTVFCFGEGSDR